MKSKVLVAALIGTVLSFIMGWLLWGALFKSVLDANMTHYEGLMRPDPPDARGIVGFLLSGFAWSWLVAYACDSWANSRSFMSGMKTSLLIAIPVTLSYDSMFYGMMNLWQPTGVVIDIVCNVVSAACVGGVIGWWLGRGTSE